MDSSRSQDSSTSKASAGAYSQMFEIASSDTTFDKWEQALAAVLQCEFRCVAIRDSARIEQ